MGKLVGTGTTSYYRINAGHHTLKLGEGTAAGDTATFAGTFESLASATLSIEKYGAGTQILSGTVGAAGILKTAAIYDGTLQLNNVDVAPSDSITLDGGTLRTGFDNEDMPKMIVGPNGGTIYTAAGNMNRFAGLDGSGALTLGAGLIWYNADGNFSGDLTVGGTATSGTFRFSQGDFFDVIPNLHLPMAQTAINAWEGSIFEIRNGADGDKTSHIGRLTGAGKVQATTGAGHTFELGVGVTATDPDAAFSGVFYHNEGETIAVKKVGEGTQILNNAAGSRTSVNEVIVDSGTLVFNGTSFAGGQYANSGYFGAETPITVNADGTLRFAATFNAPNGGEVTVNGGTLDYRRKNFTSRLTLSDGANIVTDSTGVSGNDAKLLRVGSGIDPVWTATSGDNVVDAPVYMLKGNESNSGPKNAELFTLDVRENASIAITGGLHDYTDTYKGMNVEKIGGGVLEIGGSSAYIGNTAVRGGTLLLGASGALGSGALTVADGATLAFANNGITLGNSAMTIDGTLQFGALDAAMPAFEYNLAGLQFGTTASIEVGAFLDPDLWEDPGFEYSLIHADKGITGFSGDDDWSDLLGDSKWALLLNAAGTDLMLQPLGGGDGDGGAVPEPATWIMLLLGGMAMVVYRRRGV